MTVELIFFHFFDLLPKHLQCMCVNILENQLAAKYTRWNHCEADFWEFLSQ